MPGWIIEDENKLVYTRRTRIEDLPLLEKLFDIARHSEN